MTQELKACPFCGGAPKSCWQGDSIDQDCGYWAIECCHIHVHTDDEAEAIAAWNTRTPDSVIAELVEAARDLIARKSDTYTARNGRKMGIQADDGEKCFIIHSDAVFFLESALAKLEASK